jgi:putative two-component system response regulator
MEPTILIVDDMDINRIILSEGFGADYRILEATNGVEAMEILDGDEDISAVLLDLVMPEMDGISVLRKLKENGKIRQIPVFIITAADNAKMLMEAYNLGAVDVIAKPFLMNFLKCRISNIIELYQHRKDLERIVNAQVTRLDAINRSMIETLATVIEFRDCESGEHVKRMCGLTDILMTAVSDMYSEYHLPKTEIDKIVSSAVLHDVGKIAIPDAILNKPGRLTTEEFEIMKQHTVKGCDILKQIPDIMDEGVYNYSYDICRHHHERWDGKGYPDGLKGDEISIWAQVVSVADVYDALVSPRVYKSAFDHDTAVDMINNGECGMFNPKVLCAFNKSLEQIKNYKVSTE